MNKRLPVVGQADVSELVVLSGKGGTGKTSVVASLAVLAANAAIADCDVDAADLHLVLGPEVIRRSEFRSGVDAVIDEKQCTGCGECRSLCRYGAIAANGSPIPVVDPIACEGCGVCAHFCPSQAIELRERSCGEWFISKTRWGPMLSARLGIAAENSGKLVTLVRSEARRVAAESGRALLLIDGPPGIGCPVIASLTGATAALLVIEPSRSGRHDLERVVKLAQHFLIPTAVSVNRWDLNPAETEHIEEVARQLGATVLGRVCYDPAVTAAQLAGQTVVEHGGSAARDIRALWQDVLNSGMLGAL